MTPSSLVSRAADARSLTARLGRTMLDLRTSALERACDLTSGRRRLRHVMATHGSLRLVSGAAVERFGGLECWVEPEGPAVVLHVRGDLDFGNALFVGEHLRRVVQEHTRVIVDLSQIAFIDLHGIRVLETAALEVARQGGTLILASPSAVCHRLFQIVPPDGVRVAPTRSAARHLLSGAQSR